MRRSRQPSRAAGAATLALWVLSAPDARAAGPYDWPQFNGDAQHSGNNTHESLISASNVAALKQLFQVTLPAVADGAPAVLASVSTSGGVRNLLFVNTKDGRVLALDAQSGAPVWTNQYGAGSCKINGGSSPCITMSSPAVDPGRAYVYAYGLDASVHKYAVGSGAESLGGGWPESTTAKGLDEHGSSALSVATALSGTSYLYVTHSGYDGDGGDYQGHVTAINLTTGAQSVFNALCSDQAVHFVEQPATPDCASKQAGIWGRAGVVYDPAHDRILLVTGNGDFNPSVNDWGDTVFSLTPDGRGSGGKPIDSYTPTNFQALQNADADLGSTTPAILPVPTASRYPHLALQSGKDGMLRLLNLDNLSNQGTGPAPGRSGGELSLISVPQQGHVVTAIAVWVNPADSTAWTFIANDSGISALKLTIDGSGNPSMATVWQNGGAAGTSPIVANNVLYYARSGSIQALSPTSGATLWQASIGAIHWESPVVANGIVYITDESAHLTAFTLPAAPPGVPALPTRMPWLAAAALLGLGVLASRRRA